VSSEHELAHPKCSEQNRTIDNENVTAAGQGDQFAQNILLVFYRFVVYTLLIMAGKRKRRIIMSEKLSYQFYITLSASSG
jgi:hypothetical protein